jgi:hypothetical protein
MGKVNRRDATRLAVAIALGAAGKSAAEEPKDRTDPLTASPRGQPDKMLAQAIADPMGYMLAKPVMVRLGGDGHTGVLVITSALGVDGKPTTVRLKPGKVAIFRADAGLDDFTKEGGLRWQFFGKPGKAKLETSGAIVMVLHDWDDTARFYTMHIDLRC